MANLPNNMAAVWALLVKACLQDPTHCSIPLQQQRKDSCRRTHLAGLQNLAHVPTPPDASPGTADRSSPHRRLNALETHRGIGALQATSNQQAKQQTSDH